MFMKPIVVDICLGLLSKVELSFVSNHLAPLSLFALYNPDPKSDQSEVIENSVTDHWEPYNSILLGDFNKIFNENDYLPNKNVGSNTITKYRNEAREMRIWKNNLNAVCIRDNHSGFTRISDKCCKNIDHILFSRDLREFVSPIRANYPPFRTDHLITECRLNLRITKMKRRKIISKDVFENKSFIEKMKSKLDTFLNGNDLESSYFNAKNFFIKKALRKQTCKRNKEIFEFKKIQNELLKSQTKKNSDSIDHFLLQCRMNSFLEKYSQDIECANVIFKCRRGPSSLLTSLLKGKSKNLSFFKNNLGQSITGKNAADFAANHQKNIYSDNIIVNEYKQKLLDKIKPINNEACSLLESDFTESELLSAVDYLKDSSPGISGLPSCFFKHFKNSIKNIVNIGNKILLTGSAPVEMNKALVTMIPKGDKDPSEINNTRGITLLEVDRKLCTTAMNIRLNNTFKRYKIISSNQTCHIGRNMKENILILDLIFKQFRDPSCKDTLYALFLDFEKAFDRVDHNFLIEALTKMGFGPKFINFMKAFLILEVKVCFQGEFSFSYNTTCGVPQGEVFSPSLFVLIMDIFVKILNDNNSLKGVKVDNSELTIKNLFYADDSTHLFTSASEYQSFKDTLEIFSKGSNFKVSVPKSEIIIVNSADKMFGDFTASENDIRYLGAYFNKKGIVNNFPKLFEKFHKDLTKIKSTFPNFLSRIDCFKSYIQGVLYFHGTFAEFSRKEIKELEKLERWFLFSNESSYNQKKKYSNIDLKRLAQGKFSGGENLRLCWDILCNSKASFGIPHLLNKSENLVLKQLFHNLALKKMRTHTWKSLFHPIAISKNEKDLISLNHSGHVFINQMISSSLHLPKTFKYKPNRLKKRIRGFDFVSIKAFDSGEKENAIPVRYSSKHQKPLKCYDLEEWNRTNIELEFEMNEKPLKLKLLFKERRKSDVTSPILTKRQRVWIEKGYKLMDLFKVNFFCLPQIKDFFRKILHNYFRTKDRICPLCSEKFDSIHTFTECKVVESWELTVYGQDKRNIRIHNAFFDICDTKNSNLFAHSILLNYAIWSTRNYICHLNSQDEKEQALNNASNYLIKNIKIAERNQIKLILNKKFNYQSNYFRNFMFYTLSGATIVEV